MEHIFACECGVETHVAKEVFDAGSVFECPSCGKVFGCVKSSLGPKAWVEISERAVRFNRLLDVFDADLDEIVEWRP